MKNISREDFYEAERLLDEIENLKAELLRTEGLRAKVAVKERIKALDAARRALLGA